MKAIALFIAGFMVGGLIMAAPTNEPQSKQYEIEVVAPVKCWEDEVIVWTGDTHNKCVPLDDIDSSSNTPQIDSNESKEVTEGCASDSCLDPNKPPVTRPITPVETEQEYLDRTEGQTEGLPLIEITPNAPVVPHNESTPMDSTTLFNLCRSKLIEALRPFAGVTGTCMVLEPNIAGWTHANGQYGPIRVEIDPYKTIEGGWWEYTLDTLIKHEVCHVTLVRENGNPESEHGKRFQDCMN